MRWIVAFCLLVFTSTGQKIGLRNHHVLNHVSKSNIVPRDRQEIEKRLQKQALELSFYLKRIPSSDSPKYSNSMEDDQSDENDPNSEYIHTLDPDLTHQIPYDNITSIDRHNSRTTSSENNYAVKSTVNDLLSRINLEDHLRSNRYSLPKVLDDMMVDDVSDVLRKLKYDGQFNPNLKSTPGNQHETSDSTGNPKSNHQYIEIDKDKTFGYKSSIREKELKREDAHHYFGKQDTKKYKKHKDETIFTTLKSDKRSNIRQVTIMDDSDASSSDTETSKAKWKLVTLKNTERIKVNQAIKQERISKFESADTEIELKKKYNKHNYVKNKDINHQVTGKQLVKSHLVHTNDKGVSSVQSDDSDVVLNGKGFYILKKLSTRPERQKNLSVNQHIAEISNEWTKPTIAYNTKNHLKLEDRKQIKKTENVEKIQNDLYRDNDKNVETESSIQSLDHSDEVWSGKNGNDPKLKPEHYEKLVSKPVMKKVLEFESTESVKDYEDKDAVDLLKSPDNKQVIETQDLKIKDNLSHSQNNDTSQDIANSVQFIDDSYEISSERNLNKTKKKKLQQNNSLNQDIDKINEIENTNKTTKFKRKDILHLNSKLPSVHQVNDVKDKTHNVNDDSSQLTDTDDVVLKQKGKNGNHNLKKLINIAKGTKNIEKTNKNYNTHNIVSSVSATVESDERASHEEVILPKPKLVSAKLKLNLDQNLPHRNENKLNVFKTNANGLKRKLSTSSYKSRFRYSNELDDTRNNLRRPFQTLEKLNSPNSISEYSNNMYEPIKNKDEEDIVDERDILHSRRSVHSGEHYESLLKLQKSLTSEYYSRYLKDSLKSIDFINASIEPKQVLHNSKNGKNKQVSVSRFTKHALQSKYPPRSHINVSIEHHVPSVVDDDVFSTDEDLLAKRLLMNFESSSSRSSLKTEHLKHEHGDRKIEQSFTPRTRNSDHYIHFVNKSGHKNKKVHSYSRKRSNRYRSNQDGYVKHEQNRVSSNRYGLPSRDMKTASVINDKHEQHTHKYKKMNEDFMTNIFRNTGSNVTELGVVTESLKYSVYGALLSNDSLGPNQNNETYVDTETVRDTDGEIKALKVESDYEDNFKLYPYVVVLQSKLTKKSKFHIICLGSLITKDWVLTAAHCIDKQIELVRYGDMNIVPHSGNYSRILKTVPHCSYITSPTDYENTNNQNDIALLLVEPVHLDTYGKLSTVDYKTITLGHSVSYVGFSSSSDHKLEESEKSKRYIQHPKQYEDSRLELRDALVATCNRPRYGTHGPAICLAKCPEIYKGSLRNVGGPLFYFGKIAGVADTHTDNQGVYVPISPYIRWISNVTGHDFEFRSL